MNFTREPIIETIISPKEGCKLLVRRSRGDEVAEEHYVDAIEVVSFGRAFFFRSMERPKAFLVPASDYEVVEVKEPRVALKTAPHERHIKIGGGREAPPRQAPREYTQEPEAELALIAEEGTTSSQEEDSDPNSQSRTDKRRDRRRRRHRRSPEDNRRMSESAQSSDGSQTEEEQKPPVMPILIPPPSTLISQTLSRYKGKDFMDGPSSAPEEKKAEEPPAPAKESSPDEDEDLYPF